MTDFPPFRLDRENRCVWARHVSGTNCRLTLPPRAYDMLQYLVDHAGRLITHDEFLDALWQNVHVQPDALKTHIQIIRKALGDDSVRPTFIETHRGRGYRFIAPLLTRSSSSPRQTDPNSQDRFVGRRPQLHRLKDLFDEVQIGASHIVFVTGESGIGKTTLVEQFLDLIGNDATVLKSLGRCVEGYGGIEPFYPVLDALTRLIRSEAGPTVAHTLMSVAPSWASQMSGSIPQQYRAKLQHPAIGTAKAPMLREICEFFEALSVQRSLVLVFENLHWADYSTVDMLSSLARRHSPARLMVIGTYQPEEIEVTRHPLGQLSSNLRLQRLCHHIALEPLTEAAITEYLARRTPSDHRHGETQGFAQRMHEQSGGNPLFLIAILDHLAERGIATSTPDGWTFRLSPSELPLEVPFMLNQVIERRVQRLTAMQQRALEGASVSGLVFSAITAAPAADMSAEEFEDICETLCRQESFIRREPTSTPNGDLPAQTYAFRHTIYRQTFYDRQGGLRAARSHLCVAKALATRHLSEIAP